MIARLSAFCLLLAAPALANDTTKLAPDTCPFPNNNLPKKIDAACSTMTWIDEGIDFRTTIGVFLPSDGAGDLTPIIYIPGGPGDAPLAKDGDISSILELFPGRAVVTLNPRGVAGTSPHPVCDFDADFWDEDITPEREAEITSECRDAVSAQKIPLALFDAPYLAEDVTRMVGEMGLKKAGLFSVSYGTETALHLLAAQPEWLDVIIMDSLSLPGVLGIKERLAARDRFLGIIDRICFEEKDCPRSVTDSYPNLMAWVEQFDKNPVKVRLGPNKNRWSLESQDMLDFLASMTSYPDGAGYGPIFIDAFENNRADTERWVVSELESGFEYALVNFALLYGAYSDSAERFDPPPVAGDTKYPFDEDEYRDYSVLFQLWNAKNRTEDRFIAHDAKPVPAGVPVLVLSGEADSLTPVEWSWELHKRFSGFTHFTFPNLGHAVAFSREDDVTDSAVIGELRCAPKILAAFLDQKPYGPCIRFQRKAPNE